MSKEGRKIKERNMMKRKNRDKEFSKKRTLKDEGIQELYIWNGLPSAGIVNKKYPDIVQQE